MSLAVSYFGALCGSVFPPAPLDDPLPGAPEVEFASLPEFAFVFPTLLPAVPPVSPGAPPFDPVFCCPFDAAEEGLEFLVPGAYVPRVLVVVDAPSGAAIDVEDPFCPDCDCEFADCEFADCEFDVCELDACDPAGCELDDCEDADPLCALAIENETSKAADSVRKSFLIRDSLCLLHSAARFPFGGRPYSDASPSPREVRLAIGEAIWRSSALLLSRL